MAKVEASKPGEVKLLCDVPACVDNRYRRGQRGRFLGSVRVEPNGDITVTMKCRECGHAHTIVLTKDLFDSRPPGTRPSTNQPAAGIPPGK